MLHLGHHTQFPPQNARPQLVRTRENIAVAAYEPQKVRAPKAAQTLTPPTKGFRENLAETRCVPARAHVKTSRPPHCAKAPATAGCRSQASISASESHPLPSESNALAALSARLSAVSPSRGGPPHAPSRARTPQSSWCARMLSARAPASLYHDYDIQLTIIIRLHLTAYEYQFSIIMNWILHVSII